MNNIPETGPVPQQELSDTAEGCYHPEDGLNIETAAPAIFQHIRTRGCLSGSLMFTRPAGIAFAYNGGDLMTPLEFFAVLPDLLRFYSVVSDAAVERYNKRQREEADALYLERTGVGQSEIVPPYTITPGYVYLLSDPYGNFKIGKALSPEQRLTQIAPKMPFKPLLEHWIKCEDYTGAERLLHEIYSEKRVNGEWFSLNEGDVAYIKAIDTISAEGRFNE